MRTPPSLPRGGELPISLYPMRTPSPLASPYQPLYHLAHQNYISFQGANSELSSRGIKSAVRAAQSDRHDTWFEKKLTRRPSLENFQDYNDYSESRKNTQEHVTRQTSYELRRKPPVDIPTSPTKPKPPPPAPKPRNSSLSAPIPPPPPEYTAAIPAPVLVSVMLAK